MASFCLGLPLGTQELHGRTSLTGGPTCTCKLSTAFQAYPQLCYFWGPWSREGPKCHPETASRDRLLLQGPASWEGEGSLSASVGQMGLVLWVRSRSGIQGAFRSIASRSSCVLGSVRMLCPTLPQVTCSPRPPAQSPRPRLSGAQAGRGGAHREGRASGCSAGI